MSSDEDSAQVWRLQTTLPSVSGSGESYIDRFMDELSAKGWSDADQFAMRLALNEALENAVEHGNKRDQAKQIFLTLELDANHALASVQDEGPGFVFSETPDPTLAENLGKECGRGLFLIRNFMTNVWHNEAGNVIYMEKKPTPPDENQA